VRPASTPAAPSRLTMIVLTSDGAVIARPSNVRFVRDYQAAQRQVAELKLCADSANALGASARHPDILASYQRSAHQVSVLYAHAEQTLQELTAGLSKLGPKKLNKLIYIIDADCKAAQDIRCLLEHAERLVVRFGDEVALPAVRDALDSVPAEPSQRLISNVARGMLAGLRTDSVLLSY
jgi:hypothetical protein